MSKFVVEQYNAITETTSRELQEYKFHSWAQRRADALTKRNESPRGDITYSVVEIDEDGNRVTPAPVDISTGDAELDGLMMGDDDR